VGLGADDDSYRNGVSVSIHISGRLEMSQRDISGPESVAVVCGRLWHSWSVKSVKRGLSVCRVESPLTMGISYEILYSSSYTQAALFVFNISCLQVLIPGSPDVTDVLPPSPSPSALHLVLRLRGGMQIVVKDAHRQDHPLQASFPII
jgi:hypothetical protein